MQRASCVGLDVVVLNSCACLSPHHPPDGMGWDGMEEDGLAVEVMSARAENKVPSFPGRPDDAKVRWRDGLRVGLLTID